MQPGLVYAMTQSDATAVQSPFIFGSPTNFDFTFQFDLDDVITPWDFQRAFEEELSANEDLASSLFDAEDQHHAPPTPAPSNPGSNQHLPANHSNGLYGGHTESGNYNGSTSQGTLTQYPQLPAPAPSPEYLPPSQVHSHQSHGYPPVDLTIPSYTGQGGAIYGASHHTMSHLVASTSTAPIGHPQTVNAEATGSAGTAYYAVHQPVPITANLRTLKRKGGNGKGIYDSNKPKRFKCPECTKSFAVRGTFIRHYEEVHTDELPVYLCPNERCGKRGRPEHRSTFVRKSSFVRHLFDKVDRTCLNAALIELELPLSGSIRMFTDSQFALFLL